jgi:hypothetical protein
MAILRKLHRSVLNVIAPMTYPVAPDSREGIAANIRWLADLERWNRRYGK